MSEQQWSSEEIAAMTAKGGEPFPMRRLPDRVQLGDSAVQERRIATWMGRPIDELSKEELTEVVKYLSMVLENERDMHSRSLDVMSAALKLAVA